MIRRVKQAEFMNTARAITSIENEQWLKVGKWRWGGQTDWPSFICGEINEIRKNNRIFPRHSSPAGFLFCIYIDITVEYNTFLINHSSIFFVFFSPSNWTTEACDYPDEQSRLKDGSIGGHQNHNILLTLFFRNTLGRQYFKQTNQRWIFISKSCLKNYHKQMINGCLVLLQKNITNTIYRAILFITF